MKRIISKKYSLYVSMGVFLCFIGCGQVQSDFNQPLYDALDIQGHRGCRGALPENSMVGFLQALEWGVNTLEMDVVISKDHQVVLSHEPFISNLICLDSLGERLDSAAQFRYNMYQMSYREISSYDCGSLVPPGFPNQKSVPGPKPLLSDVIQRIESRAKELGLTPVKYNIETKSILGYDEVFHPSPPVFVDLLMEVVTDAGIEDRTTVQSFDPRTLQEVHERYPEIPVALLVSNGKEPLNHFIQLGFEPDIYSPNHKLVSDSLVGYLHKKSIALIPWTVNDTSTMKQLINMGVDGIITDYPEKLLQIAGR